MKIPYTRKSIFTAIIFTAIIFTIIAGIISAVIKTTTLASSIPDIVYYAVTGAIISSVVVLFGVKPKP